ncbi:STAS domain-containing protein [Nonomuraea guangzhouensis]|uniref:STAS domain-containing protein n=1 Tax=Nonomuraea guangzhouensis TaxID=1291555 RepID=A0ABW4GU13_9ACTN|nr:STAS domain-containing protein [Nonomuraea guangzhouensis]
MQVDIGAEGTNRPRLITLTLSGPFDDVTAPRLELQIDRLIGAARRPPCLLLDVTAVTYATQHAAQCFAVLLRHQRTNRIARVFVTGLHGSLLRILARAGLRDYLDERTPGQVRQHLRTINNCQPPAADPPAGDWPPAPLS